MNISSESLELHLRCEVCFTVCQIKTTAEPRVLRPRARASRARGAPLPSTITTRF